MKSLVLACFAVGAPVMDLSAGPVESAIIAAMRLSEHPNYTWCATIDDDAGSYAVDGKTDSSGYTWVRMPVTRSLAKSLGRSSDAPVEAFFRGKYGSVVRADDRWKTTEELSSSRDNRMEERTLPMVRGSANAGKFGNMVSTTKTTTLFPTGSRSDRRARRSLQFGVNHPHDELAIIVSCAAGLETNGELVTGALSETGATLLFAGEAGQDAPPLAAAGEFKLWLRDGAVVKYQIKLEALVLAGRQKIVMRQMSNIVLRDVGRTQLAVPDEVREKLER